MEDTRRRGGAKEEEEEEKARVEIWKYVFGFTEMAVVKCAIELGIADVLEGEEQPMTLDRLSSTLDCSPSLLFRIMRFLTFRGIFKQVSFSSSSSSSTTATTTSKTSAPAYAQTPLSRLLVRNADNSMAALLLFESNPVMLAPWHGLGRHVLGRGNEAPFDAAHGQDLWKYAGSKPEHCKLLNDAMSCVARFTVSALVDACPQVFDGVGTLVDVGGGDGTALRTILKSRPSIRGINFDLPHVLSAAPAFVGLAEHVGGDFFHAVPNADAAYIMVKFHSLYLTTTT